MQEFKISEKIKNLDIREIQNNLFHYSYDSRTLKKLLKDKTSKDDPSYLATYSSFQGEVYENIIYELLLDYAKDNESIIKFILKGPYQNKENMFIKSGLLIDRKSQIVYKSSYKDISEFDALFFTKDSVYFVEMSTSKKTSSLNKRLAKKYALLKVIFPFLKIKALIVVTKGSIGVRNFPSYATVWLTKDINNDALLKKIAFSKKVDNNIKTLKAPKDNKFIEVLKLRYKKFQYFPTLEWILKKSRGNPRFVVDLKFFSSPKLSLFFDIYTKLYIGYLDSEEFVKILPSFNLHVKTNRILVTIEKVNQTELDIVYYIKETNGKLKRFRISDDGEVSIKDKDPEGFTSAEVRFFMNVLEPSHILYKNNITFIKDKLFLIKQ